MEKNLFIKEISYSLFTKITDKFGSIQSVLKQNNALTNRVYKLNFIDKSIILKLFNAKFKNIHDIVKIHKFLEENNLAPKLIAYDLSKYMIIEYKEDSKNNFNVESFANSINVLHGCKFNVNFRNYAKIINYYLKYFDSKEKNLANILYKCGEECLQNINKFPKNMGLCHNDIHRQNMIINNNNCYLIDFEYASINDIYVDLACIYNMLNKQDFKLFIDLYSVRCKISFDLDKLLYYNRLISLIALLWSYYMLNTNQNRQQNQSSYEKIIVENMSLLRLN
jgi:thiamine kinase-like enzyme